MGESTYYFLMKASCACIALIGLVMILFPNKCFKPSLLEKKNGKLIARIIGAIALVGGVAAVVLQFVVLG